MERTAYFDNAKFFLIFLVVFGHLIQPNLKVLETIDVLYTWIYFFHIPAFIFMAGFFAKGSGDKAYILKLAKKLLLPYFIFQLLYTVYYFFIGKEGWMAMPFYPHWALWFLFSLFFWHVLLIFFKKSPPVTALTIAVLAGIVIGYVDNAGHTFSLSRTIVFFPFFLLGYWMDQKTIFRLKTMPVKIAAVVLLTAALVAVIVLPDFSADWLMHAKSYAVLGQPVYGGLIRVGIYIAAFLMSASILALIPKKESTFSKLGQRTMYVYLLHGFFIQFFREADLFIINHPIDTIGLAAVAFLIVLLLSSKAILTIWQPFIEGQAAIIKNAWMQFKRNHTHR